MMTEKMLKEIRNNNSSYFYKSWAWTKKRKVILKRDNNECQECKRNGGFSKANTVHHIIELKIDPSKGLEDDNLESLCFKCHEDKHPDRFFYVRKENKKAKLNEERW